MLGMWTRASHGRMTGFEKRAELYPTDLTDGEWLFIQPRLRWLANAAEWLSALAAGAWVVAPLRARLLFKTIPDVAPILNREREARVQSRPRPPLIASRSMRAAGKRLGFDACKSWLAASGNTPSLPTPQTDFLSIRTRRCVAKLGFIPSRNSEALQPDRAWVVPARGYRGPKLFPPVEAVRSIDASPRNPPLAGACRSRPYWFGWN